jgi:hypothetical protein
MERPYSDVGIPFISFAIFFAVSLANFFLARWGLVEITTAMEVPQGVKFCYVDLRRS